MNIIVDDTGLATTNAPLVIPFDALVDLNPIGDEREMPIDINVLTTWVNYLF